MALVCFPWFISGEGQACLGVADCLELYPWLSEEVSALFILEAQQCFFNDCPCQIEHTDVKPSWGTVGLEYEFGWGPGSLAGRLGNSDDQQVAGLEGRGSLCRGQLTGCPTRGCQSQSPPGLPGGVEGRGCGLLGSG